MFLEILSKLMKTTENNVINNHLFKEYIGTIKMLSQQCFIAVNR